MTLNMEATYEETTQRIAEQKREAFWVPGGSDSKESTYSVGDLGLSPGLERSPGGGHANPLQYSCLENPLGQRSLVGYCPWGCKELDTAARLSAAQH